MVILTLLDSQRHKPFKHWYFPKREAIRIGRRPDNHIVLDQFLEVSRYHLELRPVDDSHLKSGWLLVNRGSNGTFVNGQLVLQALIKDNDLIQLAQGGPLLKFQTQLPPPPPHASVKICTHAGNPSQNLFCIHCGQVLVKQKRLIRDYQILRTLGQGGMGTTYLALKQTKLASIPPQLVVLKEMNPNMSKISKARELFEREARILQSLNHPGIPQYYDFFAEKGQQYLVMELIHGQNLEQWINQKGPVALPQAVDWMIQASQILHYLHSQATPLVHRDIKPANLISRYLDNRVILLDFGAVKELGTQPGTRIGVEGYSAPEQDLGKPCPQSDLYGIGTTLIPYRSD